MTEKSKSFSQLSFGDKLKNGLRTPKVWVPSSALSYIIGKGVGIILDPSLEISRIDILLPLAQILTLTIFLLLFISLSFREADLIIQRLEEKNHPMRIQPILVDLGFLITLMISWTIFSVYGAVFIRFLFLFTRTDQELYRPRETLPANDVVLLLPFVVASIGAILIALWNYNNRSTFSSDARMWVNQLEKIQQFKGIEKDYFLRNQILKGWIVIMISWACIVPTLSTGNTGIVVSYSLSYFGFNLVAFFGIIYYSLYKMLYRYSWKYIRTYVNNHPIDSQEEQEVEDFLVKPISPPEREVTEEEIFLLEQEAQQLMNAKKDDLEWEKWNNLYTNRQADYKYGLITEDRYFVTLKRIIKYFTIQNE